MRSLVPILCGALLAVPPTVQAQHSGVEAAIHRGTEAWATAWNTGDAAAMAALYAEDAIVMAPGAEPAQGRAAIKGLLEGALKAAGGSRMNIEPLEVIEGEGWAIEIGKFVESGPDGSHRDHGRYTAIWKNVDGKWMLYRDMWNSSM